jgi:hypothetical protein
MQRLNTFTNNKNNVDLGIDKDLMLGLSANNASKNKNLEQNGFVDLTTFNSGDLAQRKNQLEFGMSPNVNIKKQTKNSINS